MCACTVTGYTPGDSNDMSKLTIKEVFAICSEKFCSINGAPIGRLVDEILHNVSDKCFPRDLTLFSLDSTYNHWNIPTCSPIRIFIFGRRYVPILKTFKWFIKNRSFGGVEPQEGLKNVSDILTQNCLEIRILTATGAGSDQLCSARLG